MANEIRDESNVVYRDYVTAGVPASGENNPLKSAIRALFQTVQNQVDDLTDSQESGIVSAGTWAALSGYPTTGRAVGDTGKVVGVDAGTHTDPVVGGTVDNRGIYAWSTSPAGWQRIADLDADDAAASADAAAASATAALAAAGPTAVLPSCVTHFYPCDEGLGDTLRDVLGAADIDISAVTGAAWSADGILSLTADHVLTPSITARAMFIVMRNAIGASTGYVLASPSGKAIGQGLSGGDSFTAVRCLSGQGLHTLKARTDAGGSSAYELNTGGWAAPLATLTGDETGTFVLGAANTGGSGEADFFEIAAIGFCDASPTDGEARQIRNYLRHILTPRRIFIAPQDCPNKAELVVITGESFGEGTLPRSSLSSSEKLTYFYNTFVAAYNAANRITYVTTARLWFSDAAHNNNAPIGGDRMGMEWGFGLAQNLRADYGLPCHILKVAQGTTYSLPSGDYTDATGSPKSIGTAVSRNADEFTSSTSGLHYGLEVLNYYRREAQARNDGIGYVNVTFVEPDGANDAYVGDAAVTSAAQYQGYLQDRYDARVADYGITNVQMVVIYPHLPQGGLGGGDPDYPNDAVGTSRLNALTDIRSGMAAFVAANSANVVGLDANDFARYPLDNTGSGTDWTHWNKTGYENMGIDVHALIPWDVRVVGA